MARMSNGVTLIGATGALGFALAARLGHAGVPVVIGSRDGARAAEAAVRANAQVPTGRFEGVSNVDAARAHEIVFLTVPFAGQAEILTSLRRTLRAGQVIVDASVPLAVAVGGKATRMVGVWQGSAAEQAQELVPEGVSVISALHTVSATVLGNLDAALDEDVLVCGRQRDTKRRVARIIEQVRGLRCIDAGPLENARIVESLTALLIGINGRYKTHAGVHITGLPDRDLFPELDS